MATQDPASVCVLFFSSPMGLEDERQAFRDSVHELTELDALRSGLVFIPTGWEHVAPGVGRPQRRINSHLAKAHVLLLVLHDRWGSSSGPLGYSSGTIEELAVAMDFLTDAEKPMREIVVLFKKVGSRQLRDPGPQLRQVIGLREALDECCELQYGDFATTQEFKIHLRRLLHEWAAALEEGWPKQPISLPYLSEWITTQRVQMGSTKTYTPPDEIARGRTEIPPAPSKPDLTAEKSSPMTTRSIPRPPSRPWRWGVTAALLAAVLGLGTLVTAQRAHLQELEQAQISVPILELMPPDEISRGPERMRDFRVPREATLVMLEPAIVDVPTYDTYRVEVLAGKKAVANSPPLDRQQLNDFNVTILCSRLPAGPVALIVYGSSGGQEELIRQFDATITYD